MLSEYPGRDSNSYTTSVVGDFESFPHASQGKDLAALPSRAGGHDRPQAVTPGHDSASKAASTLVTPYLSGK